MERAADDQRHGNRIGVHHQDMLEPERKQLGQRQYLIDRMDWLALDRLASDRLAHCDIPALQVSRAPRGHAIFRPVCRLS
jgi:hypothetical protein